MEGNVPVWQPPIYNISRLPKMVHCTRVSNELQIHDFARSAKWCPDGIKVLAHTESGSLEFLNQPSELLGSFDGAIPPTSTQIFPQPAPILDYAWYPSATCLDPPSYCFIASVREAPVKLLDASNGRLRASYKIVDHRERQVAPHCLAFNTGASRIYCGFEDAIEVFDLHSPGEGTRLHTTPSKKSKDGLKGIIASLAFSPDPSSGIFAAGSLNPSPPSSSNIALFTETTGEVPVMFVGNETTGGKSFGIRASVTQLMFNPTQPHLLYASFRRHPLLYCWDIRSDVNVPITTLSLRTSRIPFEGASMPIKQAETNQKMKFDIDVSGKWLAKGDQDGQISAFDLTSEAEHNILTGVEPDLTFQAHEDAIGSVGFHPLRPLLLSVSGSRHFHSDHDSSDTSDSESDSEDLQSNEQEKQTTESYDRPRATVNPLGRIGYTTHDNSAKLWDFT